MKASRTTWALTIYALASLGLMLVAVFSLLSVEYLSLPQETLTKLTVALPIVAFVHGVVYYMLTTASTATPASTPANASASRALTLHRGNNNSSMAHLRALRLPSLRVPPLVLAVLQLTQAGLTLVLLTLLVAQPASGGAAQQCALAWRWQQLYAGRNAAALRAVQTGLQCCGFRSVRDRAWPWDNQGGMACAEMFGYERACGNVWAEVGRREGRVAAAVVLLVGVMQAVVVVVVVVGVEGMKGEEKGREEEQMHGDEERTPLLRRAVVEEAGEDEEGEGEGEEEEAGREQEGERRMGNGEPRAAMMPQATGNVWAQLNSP